MSVRERIANFSRGNRTPLGKGVRGPPASPSWARKPSVPSSSALSEGMATPGRVGRLNVPEVFKSATKQVDVSERSPSRGQLVEEAPNSLVETVAEDKTVAVAGDSPCGITGGSSSAESLYGSASSDGGQSSENSAFSENKPTGITGPGQSDVGASSNHGRDSPQVKPSSESGDGSEATPGCNPAATRHSRRPARSDGSAANGTTSRPKRDLLGLNSGGGFGGGSSSSSPVVSNIFFDTGRPRKTGQAGPRKLQVAGKGKARISAEKQRAALGLDKAKDTGDKVEIKKIKPVSHFSSESTTTTSSSSSSNSSSNVPATKASVGGSTSSNRFTSSTVYHSSAPAPVPKSSVTGHKAGSSFPSASALRSSGHTLW